MCTWLITTSIELKTFLNFVYAPKTVLLTHRRFYTCSKATKRRDVTRLPNSIPGYSNLSLFIKLTWILNENYYTRIRSCHQYSYMNYVPHIIVTY